MRRTLAVAREEGFQFEVILVDDGSLDKSWRLVREAARSAREVRGIRLHRNIGQHAATLVGILECKHPVVVTLDDDGEYPPEAIPRLLEELHGGFDLVYGTVSGSDRGWVRRCLSWIAHRVIDPATRSGRACSSFRVFRRESLRCHPLQSNEWHTLDSLFNRTVERIASLEVEGPDLSALPSRYDWKQLAGLFLNGVDGVCRGSVPRCLKWGGGALLGLALILAGNRQFPWASLCLGLSLVHLGLYVTGAGRARLLGSVPFLKTHWVGERVG